MQQTAQTTSRTPEETRAFRRSRVGTVTVDRYGAGEGVREARP